VGDLYIPYDNAEVIPGGVKALFVATVTAPSSTLIGYTYALIDFTSPPASDPNSVLECELTYKNRYDGKAGDLLLNGKFFNKFTCDIGESTVPKG